eukprot:SAG11_NODE_2915_length_2841_cov_1.755653_4_plen_67_part_00
MGEWTGYQGRIGSLARRRVQKAEVDQTRMVRRRFIASARPAPAALAASGPWLSPPSFVFLVLSHGP